MFALAAKRTALAAATIAALGAMSLVGAAGGAPSRDKQAPTTPLNVHVVAATPSLVSIAWDPSVDDAGVAGYYVFGDKGKATVDTPLYIVRELKCGESTVVNVIAFDEAQNRSDRTTLTVSTAACPDTQPPTPPSGFTQLSTTRDAVVLGWSASSDNTGVVEYGVYRDFQQVARAADPDVALAGLACGSTYAYAVDAADASGNRSPRSNVYVRTTSCPTSTPGDTTSPSTPTGLAASSVTQTGLGLSWNASSDNVGVVGYDVYRNGAKVASPTTTNLSQSSLACGSTYAFAVAARDAAGNTSSQAQLSVSTSACSQPPAGDTTSPSTPTGLAASSVTQTGLGLSWNASSDNVGVVGYDVYRNGAKVASPTTTNLSQSSLACGSTYAFAVAARDAAGNTSSQAQLSVSTSACSQPPAGDTTSPSTPTGLAASSVTQTGLGLSWNASSDNVGVVGYDVYRNGAKVASPTTTNLSQSSLACGSTYAFAVAARDAAGNTSSQAQLSVSTSACSQPPAGDTTSPSTPTGLAASSVTQTGLGLSWNASSDNVGVVGYDVYRNGAKVASPTTTNLSQSSLACGSTYAFAVAARDAAGNTSSQAQLSVSTSACSQPPAGDTTSPSIPSGLGVSGATSTSVSLRWTASMDNVGVAGYRVYANSTYSTTTAQLAATVSGLACGSAYLFQVDAFDLEGNSSTRASVTASTAACADTQPPSAPLNVAATSRTATSIALAWSASTDSVGVTGYGLYRAGSQVATTSLTNAIFSGLACNTNYTLAVDAYDAAGNRSAKTTVMVATTACPDTTPPSAPTGLAASSVTEASLNLTWNASTDNVGVSGYDVYRNSTKMTTVTSTSSAQSGLACGTSYTLSVRALDAAGNASAQTQLTVATSACAAPLPPPSSGTPIDAWNDFDNPWHKVLINRWRVPLGSDPFSAPGDSGTPWSSGGGLWEASTPQGPGFKMVCTSEMAVASGGKKCEINDTAHLLRGLGSTDDFSGKTMFPASGNPDGFPRNYPSWSVFYQYHDNGTGKLPMLMGIDTTDAPYMNRIYIQSQVLGKKAWAPADLVYDRWYDWRVQIKWSTGSDGFFKWWLDGQLLADWTGPTMLAGDAPYLQLGFYAAAEKRNEVWHAALRRA